MVLVSLPVHVEFDPPIDPRKEEGSCELWSEAGRIVSRMRTPDSTTTALLKELKRNLSVLEKDEVRCKLKQEISTALEANGIPSKIAETFTMVYVNLAMNDIELVCAERGESIVLYLKCLSLESLLRVREMILSGFLLRILSEAIKQLIQSRPRVQLIVKREDYNMCLSRFYNVTGRSEFFLLDIILPYHKLYCFTAI